MVKDSENRSIRIDAKLLLKKKRPPKYRGLNNIEINFFVK